MHTHTAGSCFPGSSAGKEATCNAGDSSLIPGSERSSGEGTGYPLQYSWASLVAQMIKNLPAMQEAWVLSLGWEDPPAIPAIPLLSIQTEETRIERDTCTPMFITILFITTRIWKQPRCPSADEWIRKLWYIYTMEYYSAIKMNTFESVLMRWVKLKPIIQSEASQKEKHQYSILRHIYGI